ncbi:MAG: extracellular solute-binding protein [Chloroflexota bacterium]|nr:extracellular solute-binding protein [Chloroflexota bacterium]
MFEKNRVLVLSLSILTIFALLLAGCTQAATVPTNDVDMDDSAEEPEPAEETAPAEETEMEDEPAEEEPVTVTFWHGYNAEVETPLLENEIIPAFEAEHPNIKVESVNQPYDEFRRQLIISLNAGTAPDLARIDILWAAEFGDTGALVSMEEFIDNWDTYKDKFLPGPLATNYFNSHYYGLPLDTNTRVLVYNKAMFAEAGIEAPPATMDEFVTACEKISALGEGKYCFADGGTYLWAMGPWLWSMGGAFTDPEITVASGYFNSEQSVAAYEWMRMMVEKGYWHPGILGSGVDSWGGFGQGEIAMLLEGPWFPPSFGDQFPDVEFGLALMPADEAGPVSVVGGEDIVMFQQSENKEAAFLFMDYLLSEEVQLKLSEAGQIPVLASAAESDTIQNHDFFGIFLDQLKYAAARPPHPNLARMEEVYTNYSGYILAGEMDTQEALDAAVLELDPIMESR